MPSKGIINVDPPPSALTGTTTAGFGYLTVQYFDEKSKNIFCEYAINKDPDYLTIKKFAPFPVYRVAAGTFTIRFRTRIPLRTPPDVKVTVKRNETTTVKVRFT